MTHSSALLDQAIEFHRNGNLLEAEELYLKLSSNSINIRIYYLLGLLYSQSNQYSKSIYYLEKTYSSNLYNGNFYNALAISYQKTGQEKTAEMLANIAVKHNPKNPYFLNRKSKILISRKKYQESILNSELCINTNKLFFPAYQSFVIANDNLNQPRISLDIMHLAISIMPDNPDVQFLLAETYAMVSQNDKAISIFKHLLNSKYKITECLNNLGNIERDNGNLESARMYYIDSRKSTQNKAIIDWNLGLLDLLEGDFKAGWKNYDERLAFKNEISNYTNIPFWNGENLEGKNIIVMSEQGIGDQLLFSSTFNYISEISKFLHIQCDKNLVALFSKSFPKANVFHKHENIVNLDYKIYCGSLFQYIDRLKISKGFLRSSLELACDEQLGVSKIGFSWRGGTKLKDINTRSTNLADWEVTLNQPNVIFTCLQYNMTSEDKEKLLKINRDIIFIESSDIYCLAQSILKQDLIISVTNTNIHLAGALGIPTWCLTPLNPDWHWGLKYTKCLWYDSVTLFRQTSSHWDDVFKKINTLLNKIQLSKDYP